MIENIRLALRGIRTHKMRSFLTMLGVIIGIAAIIAIVSIVEGTNKKLEKSLVGSGNNVTVVSLAENGSYAYDFSSGIPSGVPVISDSTMEEIRSLPGVEAASAFHTNNIYNGVWYLNQTSYATNINAIGSDYFSTVQYEVTSGRDFSEEEYDGTEKFAIVDQDFIDAYFQGENPLGKVVEIAKEPFLIVGVVSNPNKEVVEYDSESDYYTYASSTSGGNIYIPIETWGVVFQLDQPQSVAVRVTNAKEMASVGQSAADTINMYVSSSTYTYAAISAAEDTEMITTLTNAIRVLLVSIASLSLLVGGIGVMNIMLVSVTERTSEIGLKKALGAKRKTIMAQFLTESAVLTSIGGILGVIVGIILAKVITVVASLEFAISIPSIVISVLFSMGIGILFGAMPASKASKLNPIDALRRE